MVVKANMIVHSCLQHGRETTPKPGALDGERKLQTQRWTLTNQDVASSPFSLSGNTCKHLYRGKKCSLDIMAVFTERAQSGSAVRLNVFNIARLRSVRIDYCTRLNQALCFVLLLCLWAWEDNFISVPFFLMHLIQQYLIKFILFTLYFH